MSNVLNEIYQSFAKGFRQGPDIFFAPFVGAWKGMKAEFQRLERLHLKKITMSR
jgi:hypothetical protein